MPSKDPGQANQKPSQPDVASSDPGQDPPQSIQKTSQHAANPPSDPTHPGPSRPNDPPAPTNNNAQPNTQSEPGIGNIILTALGGKPSPSRIDQGRSATQQTIPTPVTVSLPTLIEKYAVASVVAAGQTLVVPSASHVIIGQKTLSAGGAAATASGSVFSIDADGSLIVDPATTASSDLGSDSPGSSDPSPITLTADGHIITALPSGVAIAGGSTLLPGGRPIDVSGVQLGVATGGGAIIIDGSSTVPLGTEITSEDSMPTTASSPPSIQTFTISGAIITAGPSGAFFDGRTLVAGDPAATVNGVLVSMAADGALVMGTSTMTLLSPLDSHNSAKVSLAPTTITLDSGKTLTVGPSGITIAGTTIEVGGPGATISGTPVSVGTDGGIVVGSTTATASVTVFRGRGNKVVPLREVQLLLGAVMLVFGWSSL